MQRQFTIRLLTNIIHFTDSKRQKYMHHHMYYSSSEKQNQQDIYRDKKIYHKELAHTVIEPDKFQDLQLVTWRPRKANGVISVWVWSPENQESQWDKFQSKTWHGSSVQFSHSVLSNSLWTHGLQHARPPCPSPTPRVNSNSCPLSRWWHPTISSSVVPFSSGHQSFPASKSFQMSQFFASDGQSTRVAASTSVLPRNTQDWSPLGWTGWIFL